MEEISAGITNVSIATGEHGRCFAVVAEEVGKLSGYSSQQMKQITELIERNKPDSGHPTRHPTQKAPEQSLNFTRTTE
jgi:hypothetical protein